MAKKDDVTTYTKAELIKALRASVAREAKLQKRIAKLEGASTAVNRELREITLEEALDKAAEPSTFPWDVK